MVIRLAVGERIGQDLELRRHVDRLQRDASGDTQLDRGETQDAADAGANDAVHRILRALSRNREDRDVGPFASGVGFELRDIADRVTGPLAADLGRVVVVHRDDAESPLPESGVLSERTPDLSGADDDYMPLAAQAEDRAQCRDEFGDRIPEPALTERSEYG